MGGREAETYSKCGPAVREMSARPGDHFLLAAIGHIPRVKELKEDRCWHELPALTGRPEEKINIILEAKWSRTCAPAQVEGTQNCALLCEASTEVAMMLLIKPEYYGEFVEELAEMHRLRYRVFKQRLEWEVQVKGDMEVDAFDVVRPVHLLLRSSEGRLQGCVRLLPSTGPTMLRDTFPVLLDGQPVPRSEKIWESSRFALDIPPDAPKAGGGLAAATYQLFAAMIEFGLSLDLCNIVTVTDARMERILRRAGWPLCRIGRSRALGNTSAVAGYLEVSTGALERIRQAGQISGPVLWAPVVRAAA